MKWWKIGKVVKVYISSRYENTKKTITLSRHLLHLRRDKLNAASLTLTITSKFITQHFVIDHSGALNYFVISVIGHLKEVELNQYDFCHFLACNVYAFHNCLLQYLYMSNCSCYLNFRSQKERAIYIVLMSSFVCDMVSDIFKQLV